MSEWEALRSTMLLGTTRRPLAVAEVAGVRVADVPDASLRALHTVALASVARAAGQTISTTRSVPEPAPPDDRRPAPDAACQLLELLAGGTYSGTNSVQALMAHWFTACAESGDRLPSRLLVQVLDYLTRDRDTRAVASTAIGARGRWLAHKRDEWGWLTQFEDDPAGTRTAPDRHLDTAARTEALRSLRRVDADAARSAIEEWWDTDRAADRTAHLETLRINLGPADGPLLERGLDDRAKSVREVAASILDRLSESARADRLRAALAPLVSVSGRLTGRRIELAPLDPGTDLDRDLPSAARGATLLRNLVLSAPLDVWTDVCGWEPAELVQRPTEPSDLPQLWVEAAIAQGSETWSRSLFDCHGDPRLLFVGDSPWDAQRSEAVLARLATVQTPEFALEHAAPVLTTRLAPESLEVLERWRSGLPSSVPGIDRQLRQLIQSLSTRIAITEAFS